MAKPTKWVTLAAVGSAAFVTVDSVLIRKQTPRPATYIALLFLFLVLSFLSEIAPNLAAAMAILVLMSLVFARGDKVFGAIDKQLGKGKP